jgi:hypothetical protein
MRKGMGRGRRLAFLPSLQLHPPGAEEVFLEYPAVL